MDISPQHLADADAGFNLGIVLVDRLDGDLKKIWIVQANYS